MLERFCVEDIFSLMQISKAVKMERVTRISKVTLYGLDTCFVRRSILHAINFNPLVSLSFAQDFLWHAFGRHALHKKIK